MHDVHTGRQLVFPIVALYTLCWQDWTVSCAAAGCPSPGGWCREPGGVLAGHWPLVQCQDGRGCQAGFKRHSQRACHHGRCALLLARRPYTAPQGARSPTATFHRVPALLTLLSKHLQAGMQSVINLTQGITFVQTVRQTIVPALGLAVLICYI